MKLCTIISDKSGWKVRDKPTFLSVAWLPKLLLFEFAGALQLPWATNQKFEILTITRGEEERTLYFVIS